MLLRNNKRYISILLLLMILLSSIFDIGVAYANNYNDTKYFSNEDIIIYKDSILIKGKADSLVTLKIKEKNSSKFIFMDQIKMKKNVEKINFKFKEGTTYNLDYKIADKKDSILFKINRDNSQYEDNITIGKDGIKIFGQENSSVTIKIREKGKDKYIYIDQGIIENNQLKFNFLFNDQLEYEIIYKIDGKEKTIKYNKNTDNDKPIVDSEDTETPSKKTEREEIDDWADKKISSIKSTYKKNKKLGMWQISYIGKKAQKEAIDYVLSTVKNKNKTDADTLIKQILSLASVGIDVENIYERNLIEELINNKDTRDFYYEACSLWAINSSNYKTNIKYGEKIDLLVKKLLTYQDIDGSFTEKQTIDDTGFALLALAPYYNGKVNYNSVYTKGGSKYADIKNAVNKALDYIADNQRDDGDIVKNNSNSLQSIITGVSAIHKDLIWSKKLTKNNNTLIHALKNKYDIDSGFKWQINDRKINTASTEQGLRALMSYRESIFSYNIKENGNNEHLGNSEDNEDLGNNEDNIKEPELGNNQELKVKISVDRKSINKGYVIRPKTVRFKKGETVWDIIKRELDREGIKYDYEYNREYESVYLKSIDGDGEFDHGKYSGWMYSVNGKYPGEGISQYVVKKGDNIQVRYTAELGKDIGGSKSTDFISRENSFNKVDDNLKESLKALDSKGLTKKEAEKEISKLIREIKKERYKNKLNNEKLIDLNAISDVIESMDRNIDLDDDIKIKVLELLDNLFISIDNKISLSEKKKMKIKFDKNLSLLLPDNEIASKEFINIALKIDRDLGEKYDIKEYKKSISLNVKEGVTLSKYLLQEMKNNKVKNIRIFTDNGQINIPVSSLNVSKYSFNLSKDLELKVFKDNNKIDKLETTITIKVPFKGNSGIDYYTAKLNNSKNLGGVYKHSEGVFIFNTRYIGKYNIINNPKNFNDIDKHWSKNNVISLSSKGIISGRSSDTFVPDGDITRAEFIALVNRIMQNDKEYEGKLPFKDVRSDSWYYKDVEKAYSLKIIDGRTLEAFDPEGNITRQEISKILGKLLINESFINNNDKKINKYKDSQNIAKWAKEEINILINNGIINGDNNLMINPQSNSTRAESATMLNRFYDLILSY